VAQLYPQAPGSLFVTYDSQGYGVGILTRLHMGNCYLQTCLNRKTSSQRSRSYLRLSHQILVMLHATSHRSLRHLVVLEMVPVGENLRKRGKHISMWGLRFSWRWLRGLKSTVMWWCEETSHVHFYGWKWRVTPCSLVVHHGSGGNYCLDLQVKDMKTKAACSFETSVIVYQTTQRHNPETSYHQTISQMYEWEQ
jgi:hypothetical protein